MTNRKPYPEELVADPDPLTQPLEWAWSTEPDAEPGPKALHLAYLERHRELSTAMFNCPIGSEERKAALAALQAHHAAYELDLAQRYGPKHSDFCTRATDAAIYVDECSQPNDHYEQWEEHKSAAAELRALRQAVR